MKLFNKKLDDIVKNQKLVKVISGIDNLNISNILQYIHACEVAQSTYVDIIANPEVVRFIKRITCLPICVSSINVNALYESILAGADLIEIGNFDIFYRKGINLSYEQILKVSKQIRSLLPHTDICVTIPHIFSLNQQINLALRLEDMGINMIQTEGNISKLTYTNLMKKNISQDYLLYSILKTSSALSSSYILSSKVNMPIIASSGINSLTAPIAIAYGASGVGIKSELSKLPSISKMSNRINEIVHSLNINALSMSDCSNYCITNSSCSYINKSFFYSI